MWGLRLGVWIEGRGLFFFLVRGVLVLISWVVKSILSWILWY